MNKWKIAAAALMGVTLAAHVFAGGPEVNEVIMASELPDVVRMLSAVLWHGVSVTLAVITVALGYLAVVENRALEGAIAVIQIGFAALFLGYGMVGLGNITQMPQWIVFLIIPVMTLMGRQGRVL